jgi:hypothetical protein
MKKIIILSILLTTTFISKSQTVIHTDSSLNMMNKMSLTEIYLTQINQLSMYLPYSPFTLSGRDTLNTELDIPTSKYLGKKRESIQKESTSYGELMHEQLYEIIPYSDKKDIIESILFLQRVNTTIKSQIK